MKQIVLLISFSILSIITNAQTLKGLIENENSEDMAGALVQIVGTYQSIITNSKGEFIFENLNPGKYSILVSFIGYDVLSKEIEVSNEDVRLNLVMKESENMTEEVVIRALRSVRHTPVASSESGKTEISKNNLGQDVPYLLNLMPSMTVTSDAGSGMGYTKLSIRGTDLTRINVTTNGIPLNDAESHGVWWVDLPDLAASVENIQIQRGVGTSTNGTSAFGANINLQTNQLKKIAYGEMASSYGSFNSYKTSIKAGSGLINDHFAFDLRLSNIHSDGFIDRASTDMKSFFSSVSYSDKKNLVKLNVFSGHENTYQAWNGIPKVRLENDVDGMMRYQNHYLYTEEETLHMLNSNSRTYNYYTYNNQVDDYNQTHYQAFFSREINPYLNLNLGFNYTKGKGYYEEYKNDQNLEDYLIEPTVVGLDTINSSDLVRRKWLDNDFYVFTYSLDYQRNELKATVGGSYQDYLGKHYGNVIWARNAGSSEIDHQWYNNVGDKQDFNIYGKFEYLFFEKLNVYADLQYRVIHYKIDGIDDNLLDISQQHEFNFFNPKFGLNYIFQKNQNAYFTIGRANREPSRNDFKDAPQGKTPQNETLTDYELGYTFALNTMRFNVNFYYMDYLNQLVKTGQLNDVGDAIMVNIPASYRAGVELTAGIKLSKFVDWQVNATLSRNKIKDYTEYVDNWDLGGQNENIIGESNLSFSPEIIAGSQFAVTPFKHFEVAFISKYVGEQYIDNSSAKDRMLDAYFVNNIRLNYRIETKLIKSIDFQLMANNIFNHEYETDAWVYRYFYENGYNNMDGYFPQAGINFMGGIVLSF